MKIQLFAGSSNNHSINKTLLSIIGTFIKGMEYETINLLDYPLPIFSSDHLRTNGVPENALRLRTIFSTSHGFIISVPEHNGSLPAFFKNILDWVSVVERNNYKVFQGKPVLLLSASPGSGGTLSVQHADHILKRLGAVVTGKIVVSNFYRHIGTENNNPVITDEMLQKEVMDAVLILIQTIKHEVK